MDGELIADLIGLIFFIFLLAATFVTGTLIERSHYKRIRKREEEFIKLPAVSIKNAVPDGEIVQKSHLVTGSCVISLDYFKRFLAALRAIFGGEIGSYETLVDRARREAMLRMKEQASGADLIQNMRIETANIGRSRQNKQTACIEVLAYGTAVFFDRQE